MANKKITELTALTDPDANDLLAIVDDPAGTPITKGITATNLVKGLNNQTATFVVAASDSLHKERADYVCDGVDDQVEIQAAIDALDGIGGVIYLAEGEYSITTPILMNKHGVTLQGAGRGGYSIYGITKFKLADGANCDVMRVTGNSCHLYNFWVNGNKAQNPTGGIGIKWTSHDASIENTFVRDAKGDGYDITGQASQFRHAQASYCDGRGFYIHGPTVQYQTFTDCITCCNTEDAFWIQDCDYNNIFLGCHSVEDEKNSFKIESTDLVSLIGCTTYKAGAAGIALYSSNRCSVLGCQVLSPSQSENNGYSAIFLHNSVTKNVIEGCHVQGLEDNKHKYGIEEGVTGVSDYNIFKNNTLEDAVTNAINKQGSHTIIKDNIGWKTKNSGSSTGTGAQQTIAHGLATTPTKVILWNIEDGANPYQSAAADGTNIKITAVINQDWGWEAEVV